MVNRAASDPQRPVVVTGQRGEGRKGGYDLVSILTDATIWDPMPGEGRDGRDRQGRGRGNGRGDGRGGGGGGGGGEGDGARSPTSASLADWWIERGWPYTRETHANVKQVVVKHSYRNAKPLTFPADQVYRVEGERVTPPTWPPPPDKLEQLTLYPSPRVAFGVVAKGSGGSQGTRQGTATSATSTSTISAAGTSTSTSTVLLGFDYSQIETRIIAHLSGDETLIRCEAV